MFSLFFTVSYTCKMIVKEQKYTLKDGKVYFNTYRSDIGEEQEISGILLKDADVNSFKILSYEDVAYDNSNIYVFGMTKAQNEKKYDIYNADKSTLVLINNYIILKAGISSSYYKDKNAVYYNYMKIKEADSESFTALENGYYKDRKYIYYQGKKLVNSDTTKDFRSIHIEKIHSTCDYEYDLYAENNGNEYYFGEIYKGESKYDIGTYIVLEYGYSKDKNHVYYFGDITENIDSETFKLFKYAYFTDKNGVYYMKNLISGSDPETFSLLEYEGIISGNYGKDKNSVYFNGKRVEGADAGTFKLIDYYYSKDKNHVYYYTGNIVPKADPATFRKALKRDGSYTDYYIDKKFVYYIGDVLKNEKIKDYK